VPQDATWDVFDAFGLPLVPFGGPLGVHLPPCGVPLAPFWVFGLPLAAQECPRGPRSAQEIQEVWPGVPRRHPGDAQELVRSAQEVPRTVLGWSLCHIHFLPSSWTRPCEARSKTTSDASASVAHSFVLQMSLLWFEAFKN